MFSNSRCQFYLLANLPGGNRKRGHAVQEGRHAIAAAVMCLTWGDGEVNTHRHEDKTDVNMSEW